MQPRVHPLELPLQRTLSLPGARLNLLSERFLYSGCGSTCLSLKNTEAGGSKVQGWGLGTEDDSVGLRVIAVKARGHEFKSPAPMRKLIMPLNPSVRGWKCWPRVHRALGLIRSTT